MRRQPAVRPCPWALFVALAGLLILSAAAAAQKATDPDPPDGATGLVFGGFPVLSWSGPPDALGYFVFFGEEGKALNTYSVPFPPFTVPVNLAWERTYVWRVDVQSPQGLIAGDIWRFETLRRPEPVTNPDPPDGATGLDTTLTLRWDAAERATRYDIRITPLDAVGTITMNTTDTQLVLTGLQRADYKWQVHSRNAAGSTAGPEWTFSTHYLTPPEPAQLSFPADQATGAPRDLTLRWEATERALSYQVFLGEAGHELLHIGDTEDLEFSVEGLAPDTVYACRVDAFNRGGGTSGTLTLFTTIDSEAEVPMSSLYGNNGFYIVRDKLLGFGVSSSNPPQITTAGVGDINGDGYGDFAVGDPWAFYSMYARSANEAEEIEPSIIPINPGSRGRVAIHFGREAWPEEIDAFAQDDPQSLHMLGPDSKSRFGYILTGLGDLNGDGLAELGIGQEGTTNPRTVLLNAVKGQPEFPDSIEPNNLASLYLFRYQQVHDVAAVGNIAGSDVHDLVLRAGGSSPTYRFLYGGFDRFGAPGSMPVADEELSLPYHRSLRALGDINGDGLNDFLIRPRAFAIPIDPSDEYLVVFGRAEDNYSSVLSAGISNPHGFRLSYGDLPGAEVNAFGIGDFNGDGYSDMVAIAGPGNLFIIYGRENFPDVLSLVDPIENTSTIQLGAANVVLPIEPIGDINGDGYADLGIVTSDGLTYIIHGSPTPEAEYHLASSAAFRISTKDHYVTVSHAGDVNGDGIDDMIATSFALYYNSNSRNYFDQVRRVGVLFGRPSPVSMSRSFAAAGNSGQTPVGLVTPSNPIPVSRAWIRFNDGARRGGGGASRQTVTLHRGTDAVSGLGKDLVALNAWQIATDRENWTSGAVTFRYLDCELAGLDPMAMNLYCAPSPSGPWIAVPGQATLLHLHLVTAPVDPSLFPSGEAWFVLAAPAVARGDVNMDGVVDAADLRALEEFMDAGADGHEEAYRAADLFPAGGDGKVNQLDREELVRRLLGTE